METLASDPFHEGERIVQERTGERSTAILNGGVIADTVPSAAVAFVAAQQLVVLAREGMDGEMRAAIAFGPSGFATVGDDRRSVAFGLRAGEPVLSDGAPLHDLTVGDRLGGLFIELATRRRLRVNGTIGSMDGNRIVLDLAEAYPACPKYIQRRPPASDVPTEGAGSVRDGDALTDELVAWIEGADTLFVASGSPNGQLDVSHRGGTPGFVRVRDGVLRMPDYPGNSMFNTFGNLTLDPRAGMVVPDFATGRQLSLVGKATLDLGDGEYDHDPRDETGGTGRWIAFRPERWTVIEPSAPIRWASPDPSPFNPAPAWEADQ